MTNEQLVIRIKAGENTAENMLKLYEQNRGMIYQIAKKYSGYAEMDDLMQEGYLALCDAVEHYNLEQDALFMTYAGYWLNQRMQRYIDNCCHSVRFPVGMQTDIRKYEKVVKEYRKEYGREPSERELCRSLYVSREKLREIKKNARMAKIRSLSEPMNVDEDISLGDSIASDQNMEEDVCRELDYDIMQKALWKVVDDLPKQQAAVIRMRYQEHMTLDTVGQNMGVSRERVRQEEAKAFRKLRLPHKSIGYKDYFEQYISASPIYHVGVSRFSSTWTSATEELALRRYERMFENDTDKWLTFG